MACSATIRPPTQLTQMEKVRQLDLYFIVALECGWGKGKEVVRDAGPEFEQTAALMSLGWPDGP